MSRIGCALVGMVALAGCEAEGRENETGPVAPGVTLSDSATGGIASDTEYDDDDMTGTSSDNGDDTNPSNNNDDLKLDVGVPETGGIAECSEGEDCPDACDDYQHTPCDAGTTDLFNAIGLNCPNEAQLTVSTTGNAASMGIRDGFGPTIAWDPREGQTFAVLSSGRVDELDSPTPVFDDDGGPTFCNDDLGGELGNGLPAPLKTNDVGGDCSMDAALIGTGDCSNTVSGQYDQGGGAYDYAEMRIDGTVPDGQNSLSYDLAFFSTEYPDYFGSGFNDMFVGWLESESWTGNVSFDEMGQPISLNAGFLDFRDDNGDQVLEFANTCMKRHAGTKWLRTTAPVVPGEQFTMVLAIFDLSDPILDSYIFLDNWQWGCEGMDIPQTTPVG